MFEIFQEDTEDVTISLDEKIEKHLVLSLCDKILNDFVEVTTEDWFNLFLVKEPEKFI